MKVILLVNPPSPFLISPIAFPPLGLLYLAAVVENAGHKVEIVDLAAGDSLAGHNPDLIGVTVCTTHVPMVKALLARIRVEYPSVPIVLGGPHFSHKPLDAALLGVDTVCVGDGEQAILRALRGEKGILKGLVEMEDVPMPARHVVDLYRYNYKINNLPATSLITSKGCPYACAYCCRGYGYDTLRNHPLSLVAAEVEDIKKLGFTAVMIYDDEMNISNRRLSDVCDVLKGLQWRGFVRSNLFTIAQAVTMQEAGCVEVCCGVESGSDRILQNCNKRATVKDATNTRKIAASVGLRFKSFMMIGLPGETEESVAQTKLWLLQHLPDDFDISPYIPYPGSAVSNNPENYDIVIDGSYWDEIYYHKGKIGEYHINSHTSGLTAARILELRDDIEISVRKAINDNKMAV